MTDEHAGASSNTAAGQGIERGHRGGRVAVWAASIAAGIGGAVWGYDFGHRLDGVFIGVVAGANLAVMAALLAGAAAEWVARRMPPRHPRA